MSTRARRSGSRRRSRGGLAVRCAERGTRRCKGSQEPDCGEEPERNCATRPTKAGTRVVRGDGGVTKTATAPVVPQEILHVNPSLELSEAATKVAERVCSDLMGLRADFAPPLCSGHGRLGRE